jgi:type I restriction enzyme S subunit
MGKLITDYFNVESFQSSSLNLFEGDFRLNAEYYTHDNNFSLSKHLKTKKLSEFAKIVGYGPFKRYYIENIKFGVPLISSSEMMELNPSCEGIISSELTKDYKKYLVEENTILVSCSGTIGNISLVDLRLANKAISQHALRVIPYDKKFIGFVYSFLNSEYGQSIITGKKSGAVIDEIYAGDLNIIDIPIISDEPIIELNELICAAYAKRDEANKYLEKAQLLVLKFNNLPNFSQAELESKDPNCEVEINNTNLNEFTIDFRLDAHFYNRLAEIAIVNIKTHSSRFENLYGIADCSFKGSRSIRNYVDKEHGIPFLSGKNIIQIRPDFKYISKSETTNLSDMIVEKNQILISRSGTLGRTVFVWNNYENCAASEHLIRVAPNSELVDEGYLYAFLSSDYGYHQLLRYKHGSVIDEITEDQISQSIIPLPSDKQQKQIGDLVRQGYDLRAEAIRLEDEAQALLTQALTKE